VNDWGWADDTVDAMYRIVRSDVPDDFVVATGEAHSVAEFVEAVSHGRDWMDAARRGGSFDDRATLGPR